MNEEVKKFLNVDELPKDEQGQELPFELFKDGDEIVAVGICMNDYSFLYTSDKTLYEVDGLNYKDVYEYSGENTPEYYLDLVSRVYAEERPIKEIPKSTLSLIALKDIEKYIAEVSPESKDEFVQAAIENTGTEEKNVKFFEKVVEWYQEKKEEIQKWWEENKPSGKAVFAVAVASTLVLTAGIINVRGDDTNVGLKDLPDRAAYGTMLMQDMSEIQMVSPNAEAVLEFEYQDASVDQKGSSPEEKAYTLKDQAPAEMVQEDTEIRETNEQFDIEHSVENTVTNEGPAEVVITDDEVLDKVEETVDETQKNIEELEAETKTDELQEDKTLTEDDRNTFLEFEAVER